MSEVRITKQSDAEKDQFLMECFLDSGYIEELITENYTIVSGRKGSGKTAIAKYLQTKYLDYNLLFSHRIAVSELHKLVGDDEDSVESTVTYLVIRTSQLLLENQLLSNDGEKFWKDFLASSGLQSITDHGEWVEYSKKRKERIKAGAGFKPIAGFDASSGNEIEFSKSAFPRTANGLFQKLLESYKAEEKTLIFLDDLTDHLDREDSSRLQQGLEVVRDILHKVDNFNSLSTDSNVGLIFICNVREDFWDFISGSNEGKLINSSLKIKWSEDTFSRLLIKRLPHFDANLEKSLTEPKESIKLVFPDAIFSSIVSDRNIHRYSTKFYTYMQLISFNRPRDFLKFCVAMKPRLSQINPIEEKHIKAAEQEYTDYFYQEVKDELDLLSKQMGFGESHDMVYKLINTLAEEYEGFTYAHLRSSLSAFLSKSSHADVYNFMTRLWNYSMLGIQKNDGDKNSLLMFKHTDPEQKFPLEEDCKNYKYRLHRGLYWYIKKNT